MLYNSDFTTQPELANARIRDFRRGVWKRFAVRGPQELTIEVNKNYGFNTILAGVMLDEMNERPASYFSAAPQNRVLETRLTSLRLSENLSTNAMHFAPATTETAATTRLFAALDDVCLTNPFWHAQSGRRFYGTLALWLEQARAAARARNASRDEKKTLYTKLASCHYRMQTFQNWERYQRGVGLTPARCGKNDSLQQRAARFRSGTAVRRTFVDYTHRKTWLNYTNFLWID